MTLIVIGIELFILSFLARRLTSQLFFFFLVLFGSKIVALSLTIAILFPGTVIHELSHLFTAEILGVPTGKLTLIPEAIKGNSDEVQSGSVTIAQTGPIRRAIIGLSPVYTGIIAVACISYLIFLSPDNLSSLLHLPINYEQLAIFRIVLFYLLFATGNTMFSSAQDLKGVVPVFIAIGLLTALGYFIGIRIALTGQILTFMQQVTTGVTQSLGIVLAVNGMILLTLKLLLVPIGKMRRI